MKKLIIPMLLLAMVACKKEDDKKEEVKPDPNAPVAVTKENLVGTWSITKIEGFTIPGDSLFETMNFNAGSATVAFTANDTYTTTSSFGTSTGTFSIIKLNGKDVLVTVEPGDRPDSQEVVLFTATKSEWSDKQFEVRDGDDDYSKTYLTKQ
jgi:hypothetical protein